MGMLPILVVLVCLVFLWGMVNYNSFVTKRKQISDTREARVLAQKQLGATLKQLTDWARLHPLPIPESLLRLPDLTELQLWKEVEGWCDDAKQVMTNASQVPTLVNAAEFLNLTASFEQAKKGYLLARKRHTAAINGYNQEARHMPSKLIAILFGFRPV
jgi:hypothetical protein